MRHSGEDGDNGSWLAFADNMMKIMDGSHTRTTAHFGRVRIVILHNCPPSRSFCIDDVPGAPRDAMAVAKSKSSPGESAWALRDAFDGIMDGSVMARAAVKEREAQALDSGASGISGELTVLDFEMGMPSGGPRWYSMDDVVMGGVSSSSMFWDLKSRAAVFQGDPGDSIHAPHKSPNAGIP